MYLYHKKIGEVPAFNSRDVSYSRIGLGFEKLDRKVFDPEKAYDKVAALGVKWIRIQSGWQRTETEKGVYHFQWLDDIVDNLLRRGLQPWVCLCYGNSLYDEEAAERFGAVGCPPNQNDEQRKAWHDYVVAAVKHFHGRVTWWEIWNEPDCTYSWRHDVKPFEYSEFARATSAAIREASAEAKVIGGAFGLARLSYMAPCFQSGLAEACDAISFHVYSANEQWDEERIQNLKQIIRDVKPSLKLIQGEGGCQSRHDGCGALHGQAWTREKQAKSLSRHIISQLGHDVMFASYFSCLDMAEALNGKVGNKSSYMDYGYFGVLGADFDENGFATGEYTPKPSYRTLQVIAAIFRGEFTVQHPMVESVEIWNPRYSVFECAVRDLHFDCFRRANGATAICYWKQTHLLTETCETQTSLTFMNVPAGIPRIIDIVDGTIYEIDPADVVFNPLYIDEKSSPARNDGSDSIRIHNLPVFDHPVMLDFGNFAEI